MALGQLHFCPSIISDCCGRPSRIAVRILDVRLGSKEASIFQTFSLTVKSFELQTSMHICQQNVVLLFGDVLVLWDVHKARYSHWLDDDSDEPKVSPYPTVVCVKIFGSPCRHQSAYATENAVISFSTNSLRAWQISDLEWTFYGATSPAVIDTFSSPPSPPILQRARALAHTRRKAHRILPFPSSPSKFHPICAGYSLPRPGGNLHERNPCQVSYKRPSPQNASKTARREGLTDALALTDFSNTPLSPR